MPKVKITNTHPRESVAVYPEGVVRSLRPGDSVVVDQQQVSEQVKGLEEQGRVRVEVVSEEKGPSSPPRLRPPASKSKSSAPKRGSSSGTTNEGSE